MSALFRILNDARGKENWQPGAISVGFESMFIHISDLSVVCPEAMYIECIAWLIGY